MKPSQISIYIVIILSLSQSLSAQTHVSGLISGQTWTKSGSPYIVDSNIFVATLIIEPGTVVTFSGDYKFEVGGVLSAIATPCDSIIFTQDDSLNGWQGIIFQNSNPGSIMAYCKIEKSISSGIKIIESLPNIRNCSILNNTTLENGAGIKISITTNDTLNIIDCMIAHNSTVTNHTGPLSNGGGVWVNSVNSYINFINCTIDSNQAIRTNGVVHGGGAWVTGNVEFKLCTIKGNYVYGLDNIPGGSSSGRGGGIFISDGNVRILNSYINNNIANAYAQGGLSGNAGYASGGGIHVDNGILNSINTVIHNNSATGTHTVDSLEGQGIYNNSGLVTITNSTVAYHSKQAICNNTGTMNIVNSIIYYNNPINPNYGSQIVGTVSISFSNVHNGYSGLGNINFSPIFQSPTNFEIVFPSQCIDVGDPNVNYNDVCLPPSLGTFVNDIGAHGGPNACLWLNLAQQPFTVNGSVTNTTNQFNCDGSIILNLVGGIPPFNFSWSGNGFSSNNQNIDSLCFGWYYLTFSDSNCTYIDSFYVGFPTGVEASLFTNILNIKPNPTSGEFIISYNDIVKDGILEIYNLLGDKIYSERIINETEIGLGVENILSGIYLVKLYDRGKSHCKRLIVE